ncbi:MAG: hypothetical protein US29_C0044G0008, partial [candidate division WS6 bacterium GW2011_GWF1_36_8]
LKVTIHVYDGVIYYLCLNIFTAKYEAIY